MPIVGNVEVNELYHLLEIKPQLMFSTISLVIPALAKSCTRAYCHDTILMLNAEKSSPRVVIIRTLDPLLSGQQRRNC